MNVSAVRSPSTPPVTQRPPAAPRDADGDNDGTTARAAAAPRPAVASGGKVDLYA